MAYRRNFLWRFTLLSISFLVSVIVLSLSINEKTSNSIAQFDESSYLLDNDEKSLSEEDSVIINVDDTIFTEEIVKNLIVKTNPNVFVAHLNEYGPNINFTCAKYANALDIKYNNIYWQVEETRNASYYLYGAYLDDRPLADGPVIRIIGMIDKLEAPDAFCQIWFANEPKPIISKVHHALYMWNKLWSYDEKPLQPYLWSCKIPEGFQSRVPESVSLVGYPCQNATNNLRVIYNLPESGEKENFAVCVKALNFKHKADMAVRLVEWIELLKILGADKITFYELAIHANISTVLDHYSNVWNLDVVKTSLPGHSSNIPDFMGTFLKERISFQSFHEVIQYTDCFYMNFLKYRYIVLLDVDEVIIPLKVETWPELIFDRTVPNARAAKNVTYASFMAGNIHFMDDKKEYNDWHPDIPRYMHMLQHVLRNSDYVRAGYGVKAFHDTDLILALHNHYARACIGNDEFWCESVHFDTIEAHLQHYCSGRNKPECMTMRDGALTLDTSIWRYKDELIRTVQQTLKRLGFLKTSKRSSKVFVN
ncbi:uncharacterized protein LOC132195525 [Neocloeon triangulifer]|uniref:uncharacterized protein LOC132195525 n=1 Tax=Neocloeon triangulifer TaxID=2078957 RepID=UPI00286EF891|nr:uncharacterized protein LOC132195525 [Neocloeon triangulifer]